MKIQTNSTNRIAGKFQSLTSLAENFQRRSARVSRRLQLEMAQFPLGRIALHVILAFKTTRYTWHLQGVVRELVRQPIATGVSIRS